MSMMRAAPTGALGVVLVPREYSSISTRYGWPAIVIGIAVCGMLTLSHVSWLTTGVCGLGVRFWIWLTSRIVRPWKPRSAAYNRVPSSLTFMPWNMKSVLIHTGIGVDGFVTSSAVT